MDFLSSGKLGQGHQNETEISEKKYVFWSGHHRGRTTEVGGREHLWRVEGSGCVVNGEP